jgi:predicted Zn-dependent protease
MGLQYSREDEKAADLMGLDYMVWAGYNPNGMVETMQMLQNQQQVRPIGFFSTHPLPQDRMTYLTQRMQIKYHGLAALKVGKEDYNTAVLKRLNN